MTIDLNGKAWFLGNFGQAGYAFVPHPEKLKQVPPAICRQLAVNWLAESRHA